MDAIRKTVTWGPEPDNYASNNAQNLCYAALRANYLPRWGSASLEEGTFDELTVKRKGWLRVWLVGVDLGLAFRVLRQENLDEIVDC